MARTKSIQVFRDESKDLSARIISAIGSVGPRNVAKIGRLTGAHQETVRYQIKKRLGRLGFRYHAEVEHRKVGLVQHWATLHFTRQYYNSALTVFPLLNETAYLTYYTKVLPQGHYLAIFSVPLGITSEIRSFLNQLVERKVLASFSLEEALVSRHPPMNPKFFNFSSGRWEVEWEKVKSDSGRPLEAPRITKPSAVDIYDLLLIKELQKNALQHTTAIARSLKLHEKNVEYHYRSHVIGEGLVPSFIVRWTQDISKKPVHSVSTVRMTFKDPGQKELQKVQLTMSKIPYLWAEDLLKDGTYIATAHVPVTDMMEMMGYLNEEISELDTKVEVGFLRPRESKLYTIPYQMFKDGQWRFDSTEAGAAIAKSASTGK